MKQQYDFRQQSFPRWLQLANRHLKAAHLLHESAPQLAAFWYQQAAERYLKAYLVKRGAAFENNITNLRNLADRCRSLNPEFESVVTSSVLDEMSTWQVVFQYPPVLGESDALAPDDTTLVCARIVCNLLQRIVTANDDEHGMPGLDS